MQQISKNLVAPCGIDCGRCLGFLRENNPCHGCRDASQNKPKTRINCKIRTCNKRTDDFCCSCEEFPCELIERLDKRYHKKYDMSEIDNLKYIEKNGIDKFVASEREKYQTLGRTFCIHDKKYY